MKMSTYMVLVAWFSYHVEWMFGDFYLVQHGKAMWQTCLN